jgi:hypothetical protein
MLVYSVASLASFEMVQVIRDKILNHLVRLVLRNVFLFYLCLTLFSTGYRVRADRFRWK